MTAAGKVVSVAGQGVPDEKQLERQLEKQIGCMAGLLQLFDRHQILAAKRLPSSLPARSTLPSERSDACVTSFVKEVLEDLSSSPESNASKEDPTRPSLPLPLFDFREGLRSSWKLREAPRLSLDSRAVVDAKGKLRPREIRTAPVNCSDALAQEQDRHRRSPSVVARLMGLEPLPGSVEAVKKTELRRSASESRVSTDLSWFLDLSSFQKLPPTPMAAVELHGERSPDLAAFRVQKAKPDPAPRVPLAPLLQRKIFDDARDFFPKPKQTASLYSEIERRLRMRGMGEPARDLETLKQIVEALQFKGLLHSRPQDFNGRPNIIYDEEHRSRNGGESPIVVMKPALRPQRRTGNELPPLPSRSGLTCPPSMPRRDRLDMDRDLRGSNERRGVRSTKSPHPAEASRSPSSPARRRPVSPKPQRNAPVQRRTNVVQPPGTSPRRNGRAIKAVRSPGNRRLAGVIPPKKRVCSPVEDDISSVSESSASSQLDFETPKLEYGSGRSLLERCDKLLHSIAAITSADQQPSPVSVLDSSSFLCEGSSSPVTTRLSIDLTDRLADWEKHCSQEVSAIRWKSGEEPDTEDSDFLYVSDIVRASDHRWELDSDLYSTLQKRHPETHPMPLRRRLFFDTVMEIAHRLTHVSPWEAFSRAGASSSPSLLREVWVELRRVREDLPADDLNSVTCGAIKDMEREREWESPSVEMSDAVLHIERQVFKDLIADTIRDLADVAARFRPVKLPRRKLVF